VHLHSLFGGTWFKILLKGADVGEVLTRWSGWAGRLPIISPSMIALATTITPSDTTPAISN
jgi:hypothetical protein